MTPPELTHVNNQFSGHRHLQSRECVFAQFLPKEDWIETLKSCCIEFRRNYTVRNMTLVQTQWKYKQSLSLLVNRPTWYLV